MLSLTEHASLCEKVSIEMITRSKQTDQLFSGIHAVRRPVMSYAPISTIELDAFVTWAIEALELWPYTPGAKVIMSKLAQGRSHLYDDELSMPVMKSFLEWTEHAIDLHPISAEAQVLLTAFTDYRDRFTAYQESVKQQVRNYWFQ